MVWLLPCVLEVCNLNPILDKSDSVAKAYDAKMGSFLAVERAIRMITTHYLRLGSFHNGLLRGASSSVNFDQLCMGISRRMLS